MTSSASSLILDEANCHAKNSDTAPTFLLVTMVAAVNKNIRARFPVFPNVYATVYIGLYRAKKESRPARIRSLSVDGGGVTGEPRTRVPVSRSRYIVRSTFDIPRKQLETLHIRAGR
ncbi:hypothetical protein ACU8KH_01243 [Lachancea thermotolerans]